MKNIKFKCPYCYELHTVKTVKLKCNYRRANSGDVCKHPNLNNVIKGADGFIINRYKKKCLGCSAKKYYFCPNFNKEVPPDFLIGQSLSLALLGAKYSGKSNYIAVIVNEIRRTMPVPFSCSISLTASDESKELYDTHYFKPLYEHMIPVEKTSQDDIPPLIFPLRFYDKQTSRVKQVVSLTFYDTAGENLDSNKQIEIANRYIPNANCIILLVDPLQVPRVREYLKGKIELPAKNEDVLDILSRIVDIIRHEKKVRGKIKIPLALVFTKMDTLYDSDLMIENSLLKEDSIHIQRGEFVEEDFLAMQNEMNIIMEDWLRQDADSQASELVQMLNNFSNFAVFGVSSFGSTPIDNGAKLSKRVNPRRVLDPLLWLFSQYKYIPIKKN